MTLYQRFWWITLTWISAGFVSGLLGLYMSRWFLVPFAFCALVLPHLLLRRLYCPQCKASVTLLAKVGPVPIFGGFPHRYCNQCGHDFKLAV